MPDNGAFVNPSEAQGGGDGTPGTERMHCPHCGMIVTCGCSRLCGDDGDIDGPGTCKGLPPMPDPPPVRIVLVRRDHA